MNRLSTLAETLIGSEIVRLGNTINQRIRQGEKIYNFTIGDFDPEIFPIPAMLEKLIIDAYQKHYTNYPEANGIPELRNAVVHFLSQWENLQYRPEEIQISCGGRPLIYALFKTIVDESDTVIYAVPSWNNNHYTHINHGRHCVIEATPENHFLPTATQNTATHKRRNASLLMHPAKTLPAPHIQKKSWKKFATSFSKKTNKGRKVKKNST